MIPRSALLVHMFTAMFTIIGATSTKAQTIVITSADQRSVRPAPTDHFTGVARVEMLVNAADGSDASAGTVAFEPGARTAWHSHPRGHGDRYPEHLQRKVGQ